MGLTGTPAQPKTNKFTSRNLNAMTRAPASRETRYGGGRLLVLGKPQPTKAAVVAPSPLNTPSLRRENKGQDLSIKLVPSGGGGWAQPVDNSPEDDTKQQHARTNGQQQPAVATAPWAAAKPQPPPSAPEQPLSSSVDAKDEERTEEDDDDTFVETEGGESQTEYMRRLAADARELRQMKEEADMAVQRARAADRLAQLEAQRKVPAPAPTRDEKTTTSQRPAAEPGNRWRRGLAVADQQQAAPVNRANSPNPSEAYLLQSQQATTAPPRRAPADDDKQRLFVPISDGGDSVEQQQQHRESSPPPPSRGPVLTVSAEGYRRGHTGEEQQPKLYDPKTGAMVDIGESRSKALRIIADDNRRRGGHSSKASEHSSKRRDGAVEEEQPSKATPLVLLRPPQQPQPQQQKKKKKQPKGKKSSAAAAAAKEADDDEENTPSNGNARDDEEQRRAKRRAEKLARGPRTKGALYAYGPDGSSVVCVDADKQGRSSRGRRSRKKSEPKNGQRPNPSSDREVASEDRDEPSLGPVGPLKKSTEPVGGRAPARPPKRGNSETKGESAEQQHSLGSQYFGLQSALAGGAGSGNSSSWNEQASFSAFSSGGPDGALAGGTHPMSWGFDPISQLGQNGASTRESSAAPGPSTFGSSLLQQNDAPSANNASDNDDHQPSPLLWST